VTWKLLTLGWEPADGKGLRWYDKVFHAAVWLVALLLVVLTAVR
jgi:hypothetical protein